MTYFEFVAGEPHLDFEKAMESEHCHKAGTSDLAFTTTNYHITTTPKREWDIVVNRVECPLSDRSGGRVVPSIDDLLKMSEDKRAGLTRAEVIAVVLYTGPMFKASCNTTNLLLLCLTPLLFLC